MVFVEFQREVLRRVCGDLHVFERGSGILVTSVGESKTVRFRELFKPLLFALLATETAGTADELMARGAELFPAEYQWGLPAFSKDLGGLPFVIDQDLVLNIAPIFPASAVRQDRLPRARNPFPSLQKAQPAESEILEPCQIEPLPVLPKDFQGRAQAVHKADRVNQAEGGIGAFVRHVSRAVQE